MDASFRHFWFPICSECQQWCHGITLASDLLMWEQAFVHFQGREHQTSTTSNCNIKGEPLIITLWNLHVSLNPLGDRMIKFVVYVRLEHFLVEPKQQKILFIIES